MQTYPIERRKQIIALAEKYVRYGSGSSQGSLRNRTAMQPVVDLRSIIRTTPFVVVGGLATRLYMPERMTLDIGVLVLAEDQEALYRELMQEGCSKLGELTIGGSTWRLPDGTSLDVIISDEEWARQAIDDPVKGPLGVPTIALPYLVLMKLQSGRVQDIADITRMLGGASDTALDEVRRIIAEHVPEATEDVESMITLGRLEYEQPR